MAIKPSAPRAVFPRPSEQACHEGLSKPSLFWVPGSPGCARPCDCVSWAIKWCCWRRATVWVVPWVRVSKMVFWRNGAQHLAGIFFQDHRTHCLSGAGGSEAANRRDEASLHRAIKARSVAAFPSGILDQFSFFPQGQAAPAEGALHCQSACRS